MSRRSLVLSLVLATPIAGAGCSTILGIEDLPSLPSADGGGDVETADTSPEHDAGNGPEADAPIDAPADVPTDNIGACQPFRLRTCAAGFRCDIQRPNGTAQCESLHGSGVGEDQQCVLRNDCADGLDCFAPFRSDGSSTFGNCLMLCLTPGSTNLPFDAAALADGPFTGGCSAGKSCSIGADPQVYPPWVSVCQ